MAKPAPDVEILDFNLLGPVLAVRPYASHRHYWQVYFDTNKLLGTVSGKPDIPLPNSSSPSIKNRDSRKGKNADGDLRRQASIGWGRLASGQRFADTARAAGSTPSRPAARCRRRESGGHQPCAAPAYTSISAGSFAFANVSFSTFFSFGARLSSFSAMAMRNCALVFAACRCGLFGMSVTSPPPWNEADGARRGRARPPRCGTRSGRPCSSPACPSCGSSRPTAADRARR